MPDDRSGTESNHVAVLLQAPAKIDVISGFAKLGIKTAHGVKGPAVKGHVTSRDVLGDGIGQEDVARTAGRPCDTSLDQSLSGRRNVRATYSRIISADQRAD